MNEKFTEFLSTYSVKPEFMAPILDELKSTFEHLMKGQSELEGAVKTKLKEVEQNIATLERKFYVKEQISQETLNKFYPEYVEERAKNHKTFTQKFYSDFEP